MDIIYFSKGPWAHGPRILALARKHNPAAMVHHVDADDPLYSGLGDLAELLAKNYRHQSPNPPEMELACLQKWCYVLRFVQRNHISEFFVADWDLLLFCDVSRHVAIKGDWRTVSNEINAGSSAWRSIVPLQAMVSAMLRYYVNKDPDVVRFVENHLQELADRGVSGGVCDMVFVKWLNSWDQRYAETHYMHASRYLDNNLMEAESIGVVPKDGMKAVMWDGEQPYAMDIHGTKLRFGWMHCSAAAKARIDEFLTKAGV